MDVRCEQCGTEYEFDENRVGPQGVTVKCTQCGYVFKVHRPDRRRRLMPRSASSLGAGPEGKEWLVRRPDHQMVAFRELTTLQKWIVEGRIGRDDEISKNGETWKRLGNILELEPFFSVYEKAQTLNKMIEQGASIPRIPSRGSEVLSSLHPIAPSSSALNPSFAEPAALGIGPRSGPTSSLDHHPITAESSPPPSAHSFEEPDTPPSGGREDSVRPGPYQDVMRARRSGPHSDIRSAGPLTGPTSGLMGPPPLPPPTEPSVDAMSTPPPGRVDDARPLLELGAGGELSSLPGPGALELDPQPAAFGTSSLDIPEQVMGNDLVADFRRSRRRRQWMLAGALLLCLSIGVGVGIATYGPKDNPLSALAARYGIRRAGEPAEDLKPQLDEAQKALDRDTQESRRKALAILSNLYAKRPTDPAVAPWRAFAAAINARSQQRWVDDMKDAQEPKVAMSVATQRDQAARLVGRAGDWLRAVQRTSPNRREVRLAEAAVALAQGKPDAAERALATVAGEHPEHSVDPLWLHLSAATIAGKQDASPDALKQAYARLQTAMTARPSLTRAHVLLARVNHRLGNVAEARQLLDAVLKRVPEHEEALRLASLWAPPPPVTRPPARRRPAPATKTFEDWMKAADRLRQTDKTSAALNAYGRAAELKPDDPAPTVGKGWCLIDLGKPKVALINFQRAQQSDPTHADAYYGIAEAQRALGHKQEALAAYETYIERYPDTPDLRAVQNLIADLKKP